LNPLGRVAIGLFLLSASPIWAAVPNDPRLKIAGGAALLVGIVFFFAGFSVFKRKLLIENLPTSKTRSMAVGLVELKAKAVGWNCFKAPFSGDDCVYYRYVVEEYQSGGKSGHWATVRQGSSEGCPFYVEDETGRALVYPKGAKDILVETYHLQTSMFSDVPSSIDVFLEATGFSIRGFFGFEKKLRFTEYRIEPGREIFVLGTCQTNDRVVSQAYLRALEDALKEPHIALAPPSVIRSLGEGITVGGREIPLLFPPGKTPDPPQDEDPLLVGPAKGLPFILSDKSERELTQSMAIQAFFGIFGGMGLVAVLVYLFLK